MSILIWDTETTGIPNWALPADDPSQPRLVEIAAVLCDDEGNEIERFESLVKPDGWVIPDHVAAIHGITTEYAAKEGKPIIEVLDGFDALLAKASLSATYGLRFDDKIVRGARRRLGRPDGFGTIPVFCVMRGVTPICKLPKKKKGGSGEFKTPKLSEAVSSILGREHAGAHRAMVDVQATKEIYFKLKNDAEFVAAGSAFKSNEAKEG